MKSIPLSRDLFAIVDDESYDNVNQYKWCATKGNKTWYATRNLIVNGKRTQISMHRYLLGASGKDKVDHVNGNGLDNTMGNLRIVTHQQNILNSTAHSGGTSKYKGVCWDKDRNKWRVQISKDGKRHHVGSFLTEDDAARAYDSAAIELFGEYAYINMKGE